MTGRIPARLRPTEILSSLQRLRDGFAAFSDDEVGEQTMKSMTFTEVSLTWFRFTVLHLWALWHGVQRGAAFRRQYLEHNDPGWQTGLERMHRLPTADRGRSVPG